MLQNEGLLPLKMYDFLFLIKNSIRSVSMLINKTNWPFYLFPFDLKIFKVYN